MQVQLRGIGQELAHSLATCSPKLTHLARRGTAVSRRTRLNRLAGLVKCSSICLLGPSRPRRAAGVAGLASASALLLRPHMRDVQDAVRSHRGRGAQGDEVVFLARDPLRKGVRDLGLVGRLVKHVKRDGFGEPLDDEPKRVQVVVFHGRECSRAYPPPP